MSGTELFGNSAFTLTRKKPVSWTFSRDRRFKDRKKSTDVEFLIMPSTLSPRSTIMGFGTRWSPQNEKGKDSPPPGSYAIPSTLDRKGPKFSREGSLPPLSSGKINTPGPGSYDFSVSIGREGPKFSFHGTKATSKQNESPAPGCYSPKTTFTEFSRYKEISFGVGERTFFNRGNKNPGPGSYDMTSMFDKFK